MTYELYVITDERLSMGRTHGRIAAEAIRGGADVIQLRDKGMSARDLLAVAREIVVYTRAAGRLLIVNDRFDIALASGANGVHLGQDDLPLAHVRRFAPPGFVIGISVGSVAEAVSAEEGGADYVAVSPVFSTPSKADAGPGVGTGVLRAIRDHVSLPVLAIGGIDRANIREVIQAGADGIAVISAVVSSPDISAAAAELRSMVVRCKGEREG
ncbi:MAG: thiamine phosphate synthase [Methanoregulaceae archaeon]|nr:thiamine phosphate synthase [Methanoregulaceae archaeon]